MANATAFSMASGIFLSGELVSGTNCPHCSCQQEVGDGEGGSDVEPGTFVRTGDPLPGRWTRLLTFIASIRLG
jgi:hypothetical protein